MKVNMSYDSSNLKIIVDFDEKCVNAEILLESNARLKELPVVERSPFQVICDASSIEPWTPANPVLYNIVIKNDKKETRLHRGFRSLTVHGDKIFLNGRSCYFRGYTRGIVAHDHPNMSDGDDAQSYRKNILQAKKYGFNLVRFHSTVPDEKFVEVADELGMFVHMEIGFSYKYNSKGEKEDRFFDTEKWVATLERFRDHPSVMIFCIGNEMHNSGKEPMVEEFYKIAKKIAPEMFMMDNTGWGEYDRTFTDLYAQHIAYFFPYKEHANMFKEDFCWRKNGSVHNLELRSENRYEGGEITFERRLNPLRPVMAHETVHYIDIPDYSALNAKFDEFAAKVGADGLKKRGIEKPRYLTEIPALVAAKGLEDKFPDYIKASAYFKKICMKVYFEALRSADNLCGFEMLQLSDCLKYENKNGLIDFFDDDKHISPEWFKQINDDDILLADIPTRTFFTDQTVNIPLRISHYSPNPINNATITVNMEADGVIKKIHETDGFDFIEQGVISFADISLEFSGFSRSTRVRLEAIMTFSDASDKTRRITNSWELWCYTKPNFNFTPNVRVSLDSLSEFIKANSFSEAEFQPVFTDTLDDNLFDDLENGRTVILYYDGIKAVQNDREYYWPGAFDRFKPCIWDRGHNLGGIIHPEWLYEKMGESKYFDLNMYDAVQSGYKINLDDFPSKVNEIISGVDKPVRDRMKGLIHKIKDFLPEQTLRNFSYLFSVKVGEGNLIVCTFNLKNAATPICGTILSELLNSWRKLLPTTDQAIQVTELKEYLKKATAEGSLKEDVMNTFWAQDDRPVEDKLFWESTGIDLSKK